MRRKIKIVIAASIISAIALVLGLVLGGLDRLDMENYGLNYNYITANFSNQVVYKGGLNLVGPANVLLEVPRTYRVISMKNIKTYTKDFFQVEVSAEGSYAPITYNNDSEDFPVLRKFYLNFGPDPDSIIEPIMRNEIVKVASFYSSSDYLKKDISTVLQGEIQSSINVTLNKWSNIDVKILLSSIVCRGISSNMQTVNRQISGLSSQFQRIQARKTDMTDFIDSIQAATKLKMNMIVDSISERIRATKNIGVNGSFYGTLQGLQATNSNLQYASSSLFLRPQLYLINNSTAF